MGKGKALPKLAVRRISLSAKPKISHCTAIYHTPKAYLIVSLCETQTHHISPVDSVRIIFLRNETAFERPSFWLISESSCSMLMA